jgi:hypothetical protein
VNFDAEVLDREHGDHHCIDDDNEPHGESSTGSAVKSSVFSGTWKPRIAVNVGL